METKFHYENEDTVITAIADETLKDSIKNAIQEARQIIKDKIVEDCFFETTFEPYAPKRNDDPLIRRMCISSTIGNVGPMASVAGAIAFYVVDTVKKEGSETIIIDNGGDIAFVSDRNVYVALYVGDSNIKGVGFKIEPTNDIFGICSSSGKIGHSFSFGNSDICTVFSKDPIIADACATSLGNLIHTGDDISKATEIIASKDEIIGCMAVCDNKIGFCGDVPEIYEFEPSDDLITKGRVTISLSK